MNTAAPPLGPSRERAGDVPRILVVGTGAIGALYGALLHKAGARVALVARSDAPAIRERGVRLTSPLGELSFRPAAVFSRPDEAAAGGWSEPDYVLLCVKVLDTLDRALLIRPVVGPRTVIALLQNGLGIEAPIAAAYPTHPLVSLLAFVGVNRMAPGVIEHKAYGQLTLGDRKSVV